mmetsp:Transcript_103114/g.296928  ORF Transcript_103114/g.296928 Transcript_103114/m.296928 type:complete len:245 (-) Transcript_103114:33-767(-)
MRDAGDRPAGMAARSSRAKVRAQGAAFVPTRCERICELAPWAAGPITSNAPTEVAQSVRAAESVHPKRWPRLPGVLCAGRGHCCLRRPRRLLENFLCCRGHRGARGTQSLALHVQSLALKRFAIHRDEAGDVESPARLHDAVHPRLDVAVSALARGTGALRHHLVPLILHQSVALQTARSLLFAAPQHHGLRHAPARNLADALRLLCLGLPHLRSSLHRPRERHVCLGRGAGARQRGRRAGRGG